MVRARPAQRLAHRLRSLRESGPLGVRLTQRELATALGVSPPLISSWERSEDPATPPVERLVDYATFFASPRSIETQPYRLPNPAEFGPNESDARVELLKELTSLREEIVSNELPANPLASGTWHFPDGAKVMMVCAELPPEMRGEMSYADPASPDYAELYRYADLDSLFELHGHIRAANPTCEVRFRAASELKRDEYATHLVLLGGVDWNKATRDLLQLRVKTPVQQTTRDSGDGDGFEVAATDGQPRLLKPVLEDTGGQPALIEDVAQFYRGPNPYNVERTVTICNGMYGRGTYGAVRTLTDADFRQRNEAFLRARFPESTAFMILMRVLVANGEVVTPDWTRDDIRLYEWDTTR